MGSLAHKFASAIFLAFALFSGPGAESGEKAKAAPEQAEKKSIVDRKTEQAFGKEAPELHRPLRLWAEKKRILLAAEKNVAKADGRVRIAPFSAAFFQETKEPGARPEILTIRCDAAILTLDRPCGKFTELADRKVIHAELQGRQICLCSNCGLADSLDILVTNGSLFYAEAGNKFWTDGVACITDYRSKPASFLRGKGMEMKLATPKPGDLDGKVEQLILREDVEMDFWVDGKIGFLPGKKQSPNGAQAPPAEKAHMRVLSANLVYDVAKQTASFESSTVEQKKKADPLAPGQVQLERRRDVGGKKLFDQLICDRLDLQLRREGSEIQIKSIKATAHARNDVTLALDSEGTAAYGDSYFLEHGDAKNGPHAILKGEPLRAVLEGDLLICKELQFSAKGTSLKAMGPGRLELLDDADRELGGDRRSRHIEWRDKLVIVTTRDGHLHTDELKAFGKALFIDDQNRQEVRGEQIEVRIRRGRENSKKPAGDANK